MELYDAIYSRKSIRSYDKKTVDDNLLKRILEFASALVPLHGEQVEYRIIERAQIKKTQALFCPQAPYFLTLYSVLEEGCEENAGYLMQQVSLYMTMKGLGSCFTGTLIQHDLVPGKVPLITLAFGWAKTKHFYREEDAADRLSMKTLCTIKEMPERAVLEVIKAARLAPSSFNSQPWRFVIYGSRVHIFYHCRNANKRKEISRLNRVDMGIMLANFMLQAEKLWLETELVHLENIAEQEVKKNRYYITVRFL